MKKQLMAGMMAASMALSLAACGGSAASSAAPAADSTSGAASTSTAASTSSDEQVTLRFAWWGGDELSLIHISCVKMQHCTLRKGRVAILHRVLVILSGGVEGKH